MQLARTPLFGLLAVFVMIQPGCAGHTTIHPASPPPTAEQLSGTWLSISASAAYRLDLSQDGTGALLSAQRWPREGVRHYTTDQWRLDAHHLTATFYPSDPNGDVLYFRADAHHALRNVSISLSPTGDVPHREFAREEIVNKWLELLSSAIPAE